MCFKDVLGLVSVEVLALENVKFTLAPLPLLSLSSVLVNSA